MDHWVLLVTWLASSVSESSGKRTLEVDSLLGSEIAEHFQAGSRDAGRGHQSRRVLSVHRWERPADPRASAFVQNRRAVHKSISLPEPVFVAEDKKWIIVSCVCACANFVLLCALILIVLLRPMPSSPTALKPLDQSTGEPQKPIASSVLTLAPPAPDASTSDESTAKGNDLRDAKAKRVSWGTSDVLEAEEENIDKMCEVIKKMSEDLDSEGSRELCETLEMVADNDKSARDILQVVRILSREAQEAVQEKNDSKAPTEVFATVFSNDSTGFNEFDKITSQGGHDRQLSELLRGASKELRRTLLRKHTGDGIARARRRLHTM